MYQTFSVKIPFMMLMHVAPIGTLIGQKSHKSFILLSRIDFTLNKECRNKSVCIPSDTLGVIKEGGYFVQKKKFIPNGQVLLGKVRTRFKTVCANILGGQSGHFWLWNPLKEALEVINSLKLEGEGFLVKKTLSRALCKCPFLPKSRF